MKYGKHSSILIFLLLAGVPMCVWAQGSTTQQGIRFIHPTSTTNAISLVPPSSITSYTLTLPGTQGAASSYLMNDGSGTLSWATLSSSTALSGITAATATNSINSSNFGQTWAWNTLAGTSALTLSSTSTAAASNAQTLLNISLSGANATTTQTTYGMQVANTHTGTSSTNIAGYFTASGGTNNYGLIVANGNVGVGTTTPSQMLHVLNGNILLDNSDNTARELRFEEPSGSGSNYTGFKAQAQAADVTYTLPAADATVSGQVLSSNAAGTLSWVTALTSSNGWSTLGNASTVDGTNFIGTTDNIPFNIRVNNQRAGRVTSSTSDVYLGYQAGSTTFTGDNNTGIGYQALTINSTGQYNTAIGAYTLDANLTGAANTALGFGALGSNQSGAYNVAVGNHALATASTVSENTAVGSEALRYTTGALNTAMGNAASRNTSTGIENTSIGAYSLLGNNTGSGNTAIGVYTLNGIVGGSANTAVGRNALYNLSSGSDNVSIGSYSATGLTSGSGNISIGTNSSLPSATGSNQLSIGNWIYGTSGDIGIGTTSNASGSKLDVRGHLALSNAGTASELRFYEPSASGSNYTGFKAQAQVANVTYTLPAADATVSGQVLSSNAAGTLSWVTAATSSTAWMRAGNASTSPGTDFVGTTDAQALVIKTNGTERARFANGTTLTFGAQGSAASAPPTSFTIGSAGWTASSTSTNQAGTNTIIQGGPGTGTGTPGYISMQVPSTGASGTVVQSLSEMMRINSTGVLVGGASGTMPNYRLQVDANSGGQAYINFTTGSGSGTASTDGLLVGLMSDNTNALINNQEAGYIAVSTTGTERLRIFSGGGVGINTTSQTSGSTLDVKGHITLSNSGTASELRFYEPSASGSNYTAFKAQAQAADVTYTLPATDGGVNSNLQTDGSGNLSWSTIGNTQVAKKTSNTSRSSTTTLSDDPHLTLSLAANQTFEIDVFVNIQVSSGTNGGVKYKYTFPGDASILLQSQSWQGYDTGSGGYIGQDVINGSYAFYYTGLMTDGNGGNFTRFHGIITMGATAGSLTLQWAQQSSSGTATVLTANSFMKAVRIQ